ncbi:MAG: hypothetical protein WCQ80_03565 [Bacilli bacterium]
MDAHKKQKNRDDKDLEDAEKELETIIQDVEEQLGVDRSQFKIVKMKVTKKSFGGFLKDGLLSFILNTILIMSISGYLTWAITDSLWDYLYFALIFSGIELVIHWMIQKFAMKWIYKTFGLTLLFPSIISLVLTTWIASFIDIQSVWRLLMMFSILISLRLLIKNMIQRRFIK